MVFEGMNKKRWLTLAAIVFLAIMFRMVLQLTFIPAFGSTDNNSLPPSAIVQAGLLPLAFMLFGLFTYGLFAVVFALIQGGLPGSRTMKGLTSGLAFGLMWAVYLYEPLPLGEGVPLIQSLAYPIADGVTLLLLGLVLGRFIATDSRGGENVRISMRISPGIVAILAVPVIFLALRFLEYDLMQVYSLYATRPLDTMLWVAVTGLYVGIMYLFLRPGITVRSPLLKAAFFGIVVFGTDLLLFDIFPLLVFEGSFADIAVRTAIDVISVTVGVYIYEKASSARACRPAAGQISAR
jgi:hypothetical protein